ncbi:eCIS core domain-containing protein [Streptomyces sp. NBC_00448]|uniref:eCIS core domain-containing protein n=1 Tax=Streptomyces sp. NBC_00448 TaxID=2903652 RepID=UPI002E1DBE23
MASAMDRETARAQGRAAAPGRRPNAPAHAPSRGILGLQSTAGNAAVVQMLRNGGPVGGQNDHEHGAGCGHGTEQAAVQRSAVHSVLQGPGRPLDSVLRSEMEARLDADFSNVRVHTDSAAQRSAAELGARAYTSGSHVVIGQGGGDKHTLAHELTHVIQQRQGQVAGTDNGNGLRVSDPSDHFERTAEANAQRVMSGPVPTRGHEAGHQADDTAGAALTPTVSRAIQRVYGGRHYVQYGNTTNDVGTYMSAELHPRSLGKGSSPRVKPSWWPSSKTTTGAWFARNMVQGHLLNENLGGPGNTLTNLTPLTKTGNSNHLHYAEANVKKEIKNGNVVEYEVVAHFDGITGRDLGASGSVAADIDQNYQYVIPSHLACDVQVYDPRGKWLYGESWYVRNTK